MVSVTLIGTRKVCQEPKGFFQAPIISISSGKVNGD